MSTQQLSEQPKRVLRTAMLACIALAAVAAIAGALSAHTGFGVGMAIGLLLGAGNGFVAERLLIAGVPFAITSLSRLFFFTVIALAAALIVGFQQAWPLVLGIAIAQLALAASAIVESVRH